MDEEGQTGRRETPPLQEQSIETQKEELYNTINQQDKEVGGKLVLRIPTENGPEVLIFQEPCKIVPGNEPHPQVSLAGLHPEHGPIAIYP